jgi:hypothetical protein
VNWKPSGPSRLGTTYIVSWWPPVVLRNLRLGITSSQKSEMPTMRPVDYLTLARSMGGIRGSAQAPPEEFLVEVRTQTSIQDETSRSGEFHGFSQKAPLAGAGRGAETESAQRRHERLELPCGDTCDC